MTRWTPDAQERIQVAALSLFEERGYDEVTVAEIAVRAGLTKRSFFNHFTDKRELLFAGAAALEADLIRRLREVDSSLVPFDAAIQALTNAAAGLAGTMQYAPLRRALIADSTDLQERELLKNTALTAVIATELQQRGSPEREAHFSAHAAMAVFSMAFQEWTNNPEADLAGLMLSLQADYREALTAHSGTTTTSGPNGPK